MTLLTLLGGAGGGAPVTNAQAELASGTGTASNIKATVAPVAGVASGTGTAFDAKATVAPVAGNAAGTGAAFNAKATVAPTAGVAAGTGTAFDAKATVAPVAGLASGTGTAFGASELEGVPAGLAAGTGTAYDPGKTVAPVAEIASGTGTAFDATAQTSGASTNTPAELASGTGTAFDATATIAPTAGLAASTGSAFDPGKTVAPIAGAAAGAGSAFDAKVTAATVAGLASGAGAAFDPSAIVAPVAGLASGTGTAFDATASTGSGTNAPAELAAGTGSAFDAKVTIAPVTGNATGTGTAYDATAQVTIAPVAGLASGTGTAFNAKATVAPTTGASGVGAAFDPSVIIKPVAGVATGAGAAFNATAAVAVTPTAGTSTGTGSAYDAKVTITPVAGVAAGTGTAFDAIIAGIPADITIIFGGPATTTRFTKTGQVASTTVVAAATVTLKASRAGSVATTLSTPGGQTGDFMADTIVELATTPSTYVTDAIVHSTTHRALMRWTGTQWVFADGPPPYLSLFQGFNALSTTVGEWVQGTVSSGAINVAPASTILQTHPGVIQIAANVGLGGCGAFVATAAGMVGGASPGVRFRSVFQLNSAAIANITSRHGLHDTVTATDATNGIYLETVGTTASFKSADNSSRTTNGTTATLAADTWYTAHVWFLTTTTARCAVIRDDGTVMLDVTNSANVPTSARLMRGAVVASCSSATGSTIMHLDSVGAGYAAI